MSVSIAVLMSACAVKPAQPSDTGTNQSRERPQGKSDDSKQAAATPTTASGTTPAGAASTGAASTGTTPAGATSTGTTPTGTTPTGATSAGDPGGGNAAGRGTAPAGAAKTSEERSAALDKRFDDSLAAFDAQLKNEQQKVAQERDARQSGTTGGPDADTSGSSDPSHGSPGTGGAKSEDTGSRHHRGPHDEDDKRDGRPGDLKSDKAGSANAGAANGNGREAREIPDGSDDDVVARRLRKAAEQETDPELKEKLWHEYVEYKKNAQGK
ncbi:MAG TPA: hypothetical protein VJQ47_15785 [Steroidobacteraceae bacterium]|nr:hypothetical protein [Steroidobacteraceae bacterium]